VWRLEVQKLQDTKGMIVSTLAILTTLTALVGTATPVVAQRPANGVRDILKDIYGPIDHAPTGVVRGYVVEHREATLVLRGEDGRLLTVNTAGLEAPALARLEEGRLVMIAVKTGEVTPVPIASAVDTIEVVPSASVAWPTLERVHGRIDRIDPGTLALTTNAGVALTVDTTRVTEPVRLRPGDVVTIFGAMRRADPERFVAEQILMGRPDADAQPPASVR
jgi:hypothetical protein